MKINKPLLPVKAGYLFHSAVLGCLLPFKSLFQMQLGMTYTQNGIIQAVEPIARTCMPPVVTVIADKFSVHKFIMVSFMFLAICASVPMYFLPRVNSMDSDLECNFNNSHLFCYDEVGTMHLCTPLLNSTVWNCYNSTPDQSFDIICQTAEELHVDNTNISTCVMHHTEVSTNYNSYETTFILCIILTIFQSIFINTIQPLLDGSTMSILGPKNIGDYGKQRLFGSLGYGLAGLLVGVLIDFYTRVTGQVETDYAVIFMGISLFCVLTAISLYFVNVSDHTAPNLSKGIKKIFRNIHVSLFLFITSIAGFLIGTRQTFVFLYLSSLPGSSQSIFGFSILIKCISEIPMFVLSGRIIKKIGCPACICIGVLADCLRLFLYTVLTSAWQLLLCDPLNAVAFALLFAALNTHANNLAPKGMKSTMISITHAIYWGVGYMLGALFGGIVYDNNGPIIMFRSAAAIGCVSAISYIFVEKCLELFQKQNLEVAEPISCERKILEEQNTLLNKVVNSEL